jgi:mono/diheme cytochrome c family protein
VATGDELWRVDVKGHVSGPVSWANGVVYLANDTGAIVGYDAADGAVLWRHEVPAQAAGGISVVDGTVYAGWGWWFASPPDDAQGGLIAFRLGGEAAPPSDSDSDSGSGEGESADSADGEEIYQERCASCHGGDGSGASGPSLEGVAERLSLDEHREIVERGKGSMPSWDDTLSPEEIDAVVDYQRSVLSDG